MAKKISLEPQKLLNYTAQQFPGIFRELDGAQAASGLPVLASAYVSNTLGGKYKVPTAKAQEEIVPRVHALAAWAKNKSIYDFNANIAEELIDSFDSAADLPVEAFDGMPYDGVYISVRDTPIAFFVTKDREFTPTRDAVPSIKFYIPAQQRSLHLTLRRSTLERCMRADYMELMRALDDPEVTDALLLSYPHLDKEQYMRQTEEIYKKEYEANKIVLEHCLSLLLYLCSQNAEIEYTSPDPEKPETEKEKAKATIESTKKVKSRTAQVGYRIGQAIRYHKQEEARERKKSDNTHTATRTKVAAHVRRGHYHHFWKGSRKDGTRKLILKWVAPIFVNAGNADNMLPTIHRIK